MNAKAWAAYDQADAKLNKVYQAVLKRYKNEPLTISKLKAAEQAWIKYRDAEIEAIFPLKSSFKEQLPYGSVFPLCHAEELQVLTENRIKELEMWLNMEEGNVCGGSRRFSH